MAGSFAEILRNLGDESLKKVLEKVPSWKHAEGLKVPGKLCAEQCSCGAAAAFKASVAESLLSDRMPRIADITGGLGVDSDAFGLVADEVLYIERNASLAEAAAHNFALLGARNITVRNFEFACDAASEKALEEFRPDIIYADPARRSSSGKKVFLLEECEPDITALLPMLWRHCHAIMLKVSPMADITMLRSRLGGTLRASYVIQCGGEVKELLLVLRQEPPKPGEPTVTAVNADTRDTLEIKDGEEKNASLRYAEMISEGDTVFEPGPALMKAGAFKLLSHRFHLRMVSRDTHLYTTGPEHAPLPEELRSFGKAWKVEEVIGLDKEGMKKAGQEWPRAEVSAKGIPMTSDELRRRIGCKSGGDVHIFGITAIPQKRLLIVCSPARP